MKNAIASKFLDRLKCAIGQHDIERLVAPPGFISGLCGPCRCRRDCGYVWEGFRYPPAIPRKPRPPESDWQHVMRIARETLP